LELIPGPRMPLILQSGMRGREDLVTGSEFTVIVLFLMSKYKILSGIFKFSCFVMSSGTRGSFDLLNRKSLRVNIGFFFQNLMNCYLFTNWSRIDKLIWILDK